MEFEKLQQIIADVLSVDLDEITPETTFKDDLGADSLDISSKKLCRLLAAQHNWDVSRSYRAPGVIVEEKGLAAFDLSKAEMITKLP